MSRRLPPLRVTTPVSNLVWAVAPNPAARSPLEEMLDLSHTVYEAAREDQNLVRWVQSRLGKHTRTFVGEFRYPLWVANGKGFSVEVLPTLTPRRP
jgi:hypothetical protein